MAHTASSVAGTTDQRDGAHLLIDCHVGEKCSAKLGTECVRCLFLYCCKLLPAIDLLLEVVKHPHQLFVVQAAELQHLGWWGVQLLRQGLKANSEGLGHCRSADGLLGDPENSAATWAGGFCCFCMCSVGSNRVLRLGLAGFRTTDCRGTERLQCGCVQLFGDCIAADVNRGAQSKAAKSFQRLR